MKKTIPYTVADYEELVRDNSYFVDKTMYIEKLEQIKNPVFLRLKKIHELKKLLADNNILLIPVQTNNTPIGTPDTLYIRFPVNMPSLLQDKILTP
ncbi:MAG: AAA family ATPase [Desulfobacteraceae bacterium]|nr:AAA family ATPase [Desulfobacteraceae bacterium]